MVAEVVCFPSPNPNKHAEPRLLVLCLFEETSSIFTMTKFIPRQRKHRTRDKLKHHGKESKASNDSNTIEIAAATRDEKEEKRQNMKDAMRAGQPLMSGKKKKRLDKYIVRPAVKKFDILITH